MFQVNFTYKSKKLILAIFRAKIEKTNILLCVKESKMYKIKVQSETLVFDRKIGSKLSNVAETDRMTTSIYVNTTKFE